MKRSELIASVALVPLDFLALLAAAGTAYHIRRLEFVAGLRPILFDIPWQVYLQSAAMVAVIWIVIFALAGLYRVKSTDTPLLMFGRIFFACAAGFLSITVLVFLRGELFSSRFIILAAWFLAIVYVTAVRLLVRQIQRQLFRYGFAAHRIMVIGQGHLAKIITENIALQPELGYKVVGVLPPQPASLGEVINGVKNNIFDEILFIDAGSTPEMRQSFLEAAEEYHINFRYSPDLVMSPIGHPQIDFELGAPVIELPETTLVGWGKLIKRFFDIVLAGLAIILLAPAFLIITTLIWLETGWPIIYKSIRIGRGREFKFYKFRSMKKEYCVGPEYGGAPAEEFETKLIQKQNFRDGPVPKIKDDPRLTKVGRFLRRFSLDEMPQFWNVFIGDMSLVGPRPHLPKEVANYAKHHKKVLAIKPGLTGLAQVSGRSDLDFDEEVRLDRFYIEHWSSWLDIRILLKTCYVIFERRKTI